MSVLTRIRTLDYGFGDFSTSCDFTFVPYSSRWLVIIAAIWWHGSGSTLAQVMAWCLTAPSHYLNQCWLIINEILWHSFTWGWFHRKFSRYLILIWIWKVSILQPNLPGVNELTLFNLQGLRCCMRCDAIPLSVCGFLIINHCCAVVVLQLAYIPYRLGPRLLHSLSVVCGTAIWDMKHCWCCGLFGLNQPNYRLGESSHALNRW